MKFEAALAQAKEWGVKLRYGADPWHKIVQATRTNSAHSELHVWNEAIGKWEPAVLKIEQALGDRWETEPKPKEPRRAYINESSGLAFFLESGLRTIHDGLIRAAWLDEPHAKIDAPTKPESLK